MYGLKMNKYSKIFNFGKKFELKQSIENYFFLFNGPSNLAVDRLQVYNIARNVQLQFYDAETVGVRIGKV